ncbi:MAG: hypothetical protein Q9214_000133 [Letrouitia sp. 1 TL-2023]
MPCYFFHLLIDLHTSHPGSRISLEEQKAFCSTLKAQTLPPTSQSKGGNISNPKALVSTKVDYEIQTLPESRSSCQDITTITDSSIVTNDWRYDAIKVQNIDMLPAMSAGEQGSQAREDQGQIANRIAAGTSIASKGRFEPISREEEDIGWGVVRLYRDAGETQGLYDDVTTNRGKNSRGIHRKSEGEASSFRDEDCTTLCILAVPSYLTPSDFLGFVGEKTRDEVSHFRMIRTERGNRYMVLMKFRSGKRAREWRKAWNGKAFDSMDPENCHVVFVKSIDVSTHDAGDQQSFPDMTNDPFTPQTTQYEPPASTLASASSALPSTSRNAKPIAPPTPSLVELPTCPVCLERMDESTGLLTILCQHVFHCSCLQKWRGSGCPVCRYTQDGLFKRSSGEQPELNECSVCRSDANLWICLICGNVGCGRYDAAHAFFHYQQTSHCFAMDLMTQRVWDYATDGYVHRIMQDKKDGKLVEMPASATEDHVGAQDGNAWDYEDYVPREKLDNIGLEYTHLLTSQLESQRAYFSEILERAADKASQATNAAEDAKALVMEVQQQLATLQASHNTLTKETIPTLEKAKDRATGRAEKFEITARKLEKEWRDEKAVSGSLMERIGWLEGQVKTLNVEKNELHEQNRDLSFFISGGEKLKTLQGVEEEELKESSATVAEAPQKGKGRKTGGKGKK